MKIAKILIALGAVTGLLAFVSPANAQVRANHGGNVNRGHFRDFDHDHDRDHFRGRVFFAAGFGFPFFYGYPYWGYPYYYGYPYGYYGYPYYGYPGYGYDVNGANAGRTAGPGNDNSMTIQVQRQLAAAGYYHGAIDGVIGDGTRRAIRHYERDNGLPVDGRISNQLLNAMRRG